MRQSEHEKPSGGTRLLVVAGMVGALMTACGGQLQTVEVTGPAAATASPLLPPGPLETFQGEVAEVDVDAGEILLEVQIVWAPVLRADPHQRLVLVDPQTRWEPGAAGITGLHVGDPVQVEGVRAPDGSWRAVEVQLFDID